MKRVLCAVMALMMVVVGGAWAEQEELHLLWGIEFGQDIETVQEILKNEHGLEMEYSKTEYEDHIGEYLTYHSSWNVYTNSWNGEEVTILGYPLASIGWYVTNYSDHRAEGIRIRFTDRKTSELYDTVYEEKEAMPPLADILNTLVEQFGPIDFAVYSTYSEGIEATREKNKDYIHEYRHLTDLSIDALNPRAIFDNKDYITPNTYVSMSIYIDNICVSCSATPKEYHIDVLFMDSLYEDTNEDFYEEFKVARYEDKGF